MKSSSKITIVVLVLIILIGAISFGVQQTGLSPSDAIYVNTYGRLECSAARPDFPLIETTNLKDKSTTTITCGQNMNAYTDRCKIEMFYPYGWCYIDKIEQCNNAGCKDVPTSFFGRNSWQEILDARLDTNNDGVITAADGDVYKTIKITTSSGILCTSSSARPQIRATGTAYRLKDISSTGYVTSYAQGCNLNYLKSTTHTFNYKGDQQVPFGEQLLYVDGATKIISSNVVAQSGQRFYIQTPGYKIPIKRADDGTYFANYQDQIAAPEIECLPANVYNCNADGTLREVPSQDVSGQDCSAIRGVPNNQFLRVTGTNECCQFSCVNNLLVKSNCEACAVCGDEFAYNSASNKCVKVQDSSGNQTNQCTEWWQVPGTKVSVDRSWYNYLGIGKPVVTETPTCNVAGWLVYLIIAGVVTIVLISALIIFRPEIKKGIKQRK